MVLWKIYQPDAPKPQVEKPPQAVTDPAPRVEHKPDVPKPPSPQETPKVEPVAAAPAQRIVLARIHFDKARAPSGGSILLDGKPYRVDSDGLLRAKVTPEDRALTMEIDVPGYEHSTTRVRSVPMDRPGDPVDIDLQPSDPSR